MTSTDYAGAIAAYTSAIALDPTNSLNYSNRAAAHSSSNNHKETVNDAQRAIEVDPNFVDAYYRLGSVAETFSLATLVIRIPDSRHAFYCLGDYQESVNAFQRGLDLDPSNANLKSGRDHARAHIPSPSAPKPIQPTPEGGAGGLIKLFNTSGTPEGGGRGGPDITQLLRTMPEVMQIVEQLLGQNGGLGTLGGGGGGGPDITQLLGTMPEVMQIAEQLMGQNGGLGGLIGNPAISNMVSILNFFELPTFDHLR
jgi:small glutamine-rich tetratricopeptide repeat-containing protein alpha